jgi:hypothetical protein
VVLLICVVLLLDLGLFWAVSAGSNAENCDASPSATGGDWYCSGIVQTLSAHSAAVLVAVLVISFLAPIAYAIYDDRRREGPLREALEND